MATDSLGRYRGRESCLHRKRHTKETAVIDIRTFMLVLAIGNIGFALLVGGYVRGRTPHAAMPIWAWAKVVQGAAHLLGFLRPDFPSAIVAAAANTALIVGATLELAAYSVFLGSLRWKTRLVPAAALALVLMHGARLAALPSYQLMAVMSGIICLFSMAMAWLLLRPGKEKSLLQRMIGWNDVVFCLAMGGRAVLAITDRHQHVFASGTVQTVTLFAGYLLMIVNGFGFLLLCKEKDDARMVQLATVDNLTGLINRHAFFDRTEGARALAARQHSPISLLMIDIDHFKRINDCFGHATGDEALCLFARTTESVLRDQDIMGRLGGEEFALVLPDTDLEGAILAAERLRQTVAGVTLQTTAAPYAMTISVGVVVIDPHEHINAALARADHALYAAKTGGRNRVHVGPGRLRVVTA
jgi:diguanylate cyclase (GGDEF)-like protein